MRIDRGILLAVFFLLGLGLVQVYSSSYIFATETYGDGLLFFRRQALFALLALLGLFSVYILPWRHALRLGQIAWVFAAFCVLLTLIPGLGIRVGGAARWLALPMGWRFEPGELLRVTYPFMLAPLLAAFVKQQVDRAWWIRLGLVLLPLLPVYLQPDFGSVVIVLALVLCLFFCFGLKWRYLLLGGAVAIPVLAVMILAFPYRRMRIEAFLNPWADPADKGFQVIQSLVTFYSGGLTGVGLGQGQGKLFFLPEAHTDFTLAVLGEEMGFIGFFILLMVYGFIVFRGFQITLALKSIRERSMALAFTLLLMFSVFINIGVALGILPTKGLTLPLLSYGGSSLIATGLLIGWLLNLARESTLRFEKKEID